MTSAPGIRSGRPTMQDVARLAGVSVKTVSRAVNYEPGVHLATQKKIDAAIAQLNFRRNESASQLRSGRTDSIGLIVEDVSDPFYSMLISAVEKVVRQHNFLLLTGSAEGSVERERTLTSAFLSRRVSGLLVVPAGQDHSWLAGEIGTDTPVVFMDRPATGLSADTVLIDNEGGVRSAVEHLAAHGHRNIGFLADDPQFWTAAHRLAGFVSAVSALGLRSDATATGPYSVKGLSELLASWTSGDNPVTAVITGNNRVTIGTLRAMRQSSLRLALVGFDDFELADLLVPSITAVAQNPMGMGERAANLLFNRLSGNQTAESLTEVLPTRLVVRESSVIGAIPFEGSRG